MNDIVVAGHICCDITPSFLTKIDLKKDLIPGKLINIGKATVSTGGCVANTGLALKKLGADVKLIFRIGEDLIGKIIVEILKNFIPSIKVKITKGESSAYSIVIAPPKIDRIFLEYTGQNEKFGFSDINFKIVEETKIFHLGYPPLLRKLYINDGYELLKIFKKVKKLNKITSMDVSLPDPASESGKVNWSSILKKVLPYVDIFIPSFEEALFMLKPSKYWNLKSKGDLINIFDEKDLKEISETILNYGARIAAIKCGHRGLYVKTTNCKVLEKFVDPKKWSYKEIFSPAFKVKKILSATGAGDCAVAGFLMSIIKGKTLVEAAKIANACGAQNLTAYDAISGLKGWETVEKQ